MKPRFTDAHGTLVYAIPGAAPAIDAPFEPAMKPLVGANMDVRFAKFKPFNNVSTQTLAVQQEGTTISMQDAFPFAKVPQVMFFSLVNSTDTGARERQLWKLCSLFLDDLGAAAAETARGVPDTQREDLEEQIRMDALGAFWAKEILVEDVKVALKKAGGAEEKALVLLTNGDVGGACEVLAQGGDYKLAMLVSQLPGSERSRELVRKQTEHWRARNDWAEFSDAVRALYSICAGEVCRVDRKSVV